MPFNQRWRYLSPLTLRVVQLLCREGWLSREEIAEKLHENPEGDIRPLLTDLAKRGILESSGRKGYHVDIPEEADPDTYRRQLLEWLERQVAVPDDET